MSARFLACLALAAMTVQAADVDVSPVEKVITMLTDLQTQVIMEGKIESKTYDKYACFCKDMSTEKNQAITDGEDSVSTIEGTIATLTSSRSSLDGDISDLTSDILGLNKYIKEAIAQRKKDESDYVVEEAEISHATDCVKGAVGMLNAQMAAFNKAGLLQKHSGEHAHHDAQESSAAQKQEFTKAIRLAAAIADKKGVLSDKKRRVFQALLESSDPLGMVQAAIKAGSSGKAKEPEETEFASGEIVEVVEDLEVDFEDTLTDTRSTETTESTEHRHDMENKQSELSDKTDELAQKQAEKAEKIEGIAVQSKDLTITAATLADDKAYLLQLNDKCNLKSAQWDQRSQMRTEEITALTTAIHIVKGKVSEKTSDKTVRLVQTGVEADADATPSESVQSQVDDLMSEEELSFAQLGASPRHRAQLLVKKHKSLSNLGEGARKFLGLPTEEAESAKRTFVLNLLKSKGADLKSATLIKLAATMAADPFAKIKTLIQELVERLLQEAADEANHKGWCDKELGKAKQSRKMKVEAVTRLNDRLAMAESKRDKLMEEIGTLTDEMTELNDSMTKNAKERSEEHSENSATVSEAEEGKEAVEEAITVLSRFYKTAAKAEEPAATLLVKEQEIRLAAHGVDEDEPDAGFDSAYKGSQGASSGILGMLDVILSDFVRTLETTEKEEKNASDQALDFQTATKVSLGKKTVGKTNRADELSETRSQILEDNNSLIEEQELLDKTIQELNELRPQCIDTSMSYAERVEKREHEIEAMKQALCILGQEGPVQTESGC